MLIVPPGRASRRPATSHPPAIFSRFTVEEANALLPQLRQHLDDLRAARERLLQAQEALAQRFHGGARSNGRLDPNCAGRVHALRGHNWNAPAVRRVGRCGGSHLHSTGPRSSPGEHACPDTGDAARLIPHP